MRPKTWAARSRTPPKPSRLSINRRSPVRRTSTLATAAMLRMFKPFLAMQEEFGNFDQYSWQFVDGSRNRSGGALSPSGRRTPPSPTPSTRISTARVQNATAHDHLRTHAGDWHGDDHLVSYPCEAEPGSIRESRKLQSVPELAEVEYFRRRWDDGIGRRVVRVDLHGKKRVFRDSDPDLIEKTLRGQKLLGSEGREADRGSVLQRRVAGHSSWDVRQITRGSRGLYARQARSSRAISKDADVGFLRPANVRTRSLPRWEGDSGLVGEPPTGGDLARVHRGTAMPHSAAPPAHFAEGAAFEGRLARR